MLKTDGIYYNIGKKEILKNVSADFLPEEFNMILGPNGSGKSTFLKIFSGELNGYKGNVLYSNTNINDIKKSELAKERAVLSQQPELSFPLLVEEVILMGRYPFFSFKPNRKDLDICDEAMNLLQLNSFRERNYLTLSGGEKQRVQFARILAQIWEQPANSTRYLFLDEPLSNLDINYQQEFLEIAAGFAKKNTVLVAVMHDINQAIQYGDKLYFLKAGEIVASGPPSSIITEALLAQVFDVNTRIISNPVTGKPLVLFNKS